MPPKSDLYVGRENELAQIMETFDAVDQGDGRVILLSGEPGIGKTRIAETVTEMASNREFITLHSRCDQAEITPPYWPWIQIFRGLFDMYDASDIDSDKKALISIVSEIDSQIGRLFSNLPAEPAIEDPVSARFRLFDAITSLLVFVSADRNLLMVFDDLVWADHPSIMLMGFFLRHVFPSSIMLIGTYRDVELNRRHPLRDLLGELARERRFDRIILRGLAFDEVDEMVRATALEPKDGLIDEIFRLTQGNPLFVKELLPLLNDQADNFGGSSDFRIPEGVREAIGVRLNRLTSECYELLLFAATIGRQFDLGVLTKFAHSGTEVVERLEEAISAGIVVAMDRPGRYQFIHELTQRTIIDEMSTMQRMRLHAAVAVALESEYGSSAMDYATELAEHYSESEAISDPEKVFRYLSAAGKHALSIYAHDDAARFFERALAANHSGVAKRDIAFAQFGLGSAYAANSDQRACKHVRKAFDLFESEGLIEEAVKVAGIRRTVPDCKLLDVFDRGLELATPKTIESARIHANIANEIAFGELDVDRANALFDEAFSIALAEVDIQLQMQIEATRSFIDALQMKLDTQIERSRNVIRMAKQHRDLRAETLAAAMAAAACRTTGAIDESIKFSAQCLSGAERLGEATLLGQALHANAILAFAFAEWDRAKEYMIRGSKYPSPIPLAHRALLEAETGNREEALEFLSRAIEIDQRGAIVGSLTLCLIRTNDPSLLDLARKQITLLKEHLGSTLRAEQNRLRLAVCSSCLAYFTRDTADFDEAYEMLLSKTEFAGPINACDRYLGFIEVVRGNFSRAIEHFDRSIAKSKNTRFVVLEGWDNFFRAATILESRHSGDIDFAVGELALLKEHSEVHGMVLLGQRVDSLIADYEKSQSADRDRFNKQHPDGLTDREIEVMGLVAQGQSNMQIGSELFISTRTVANHIRNIFKKIGADSRAQVAAYAVKHSLG